MTPDQASESVSGVQYYLGKPKFGIAVKAQNGKDPAKPVYELQVGSEADRSQAYTACLSSGWFVSDTFDIELTDDGRLESVNVVSDDETGPVIAALGSIALAAGGLFGPAVDVSAIAAENFTDLAPDSPVRTVDEYLAVIKGLEKERNAFCEAIQPGLARGGEPSDMGLFLVAFKQRQIALERDGLAVARKDAAKSTPPSDQVRMITGLSELKKATEKPFADWVLDGTTVNKDAFEKAVKLYKDAVERALKGSASVTPIPPLLIERHQALVAALQQTDLSDGAEGLGETYSKLVDQLNKVEAAVLALISPPTPAPAAKPKPEGDKVTAQIQAPVALRVRDRDRLPVYRHFALALVESRTFDAAVIYLEL